MRLVSSLALVLLLGCQHGSATPNGVEPAVTADAPEDVAAQATIVAPGEIDVAGLEALLDDDTVLIDVRTPGEFEAVRAVGTVNIPLGDLDARLAELEPHKGDTIYLICRSGNRSGKAAAALSKQGYTAVNVLGGTLAWEAAGYPVEP